MLPTRIGFKNTWLLSNRSQRIVWKTQEKNLGYKISINLTPKIHQILAKQFFCFNPNPFSFPRERKDSTLTESQLVSQKDFFLFQRKDEISYRKV